MTTITTIPCSPERAAPQSEGLQQDPRWLQWHGLKFGMISFAVLIITMMWLAGIAYFQYATQRQIEYTYRTNDSLSAAFAAHTAQALREIEGLLRVVSLEHRRSGRRFNLQAFAREARIDPAMIKALIILDREGKLLQASQPDYNNKSHADREHFRVHVDKNSDQLYSAKPVQGRYSKAQVIPFSLRITGPHGEFMGVAVAGVNPEHFINLYKKANLGDKGASSFFGLDGFIRARITSGKIGVGQDVRKALMIKVARENESGRLLFTAVTDKVKRYYSYQRVPGHPLSIAVGQSDDEALAEVNRITHAVLIGGVIITLLMCVATILLVRGLSREQQSKKSLQNRTQDLSRVNSKLQRSLEDLQRAQAHLVQSEKMAALGGLVAGVAHEINTPVGIGVTAASHLQMTVRDAGERYRTGQLTRSEMEVFLKNADTATQMVLSNLGRAADLVRSFKQVAVDQSSNARRQFKLKPYLEEVLISLSPTLKTRHVVEIECADELNIYSHPGAYSQIITNLVMNSVTHGFEGIEGGHITIAVSEQSEGLLLRYSDDGKGIAPEHLPKIFDPFFTTKRGQGGSGLGMHVVYNLVTQMMGGSIVCESTPGQGVRFEIKTPIKQMELEASATSRTL